MNYPYSSWMFSNLWWINNCVSFPETNTVFLGAPNGYMILKFVILLTLVKCSLLNSVWWLILPQLFNRHSRKLCFLHILTFRLTARVHNLYPGSGGLLNYCRCVIISSVSTETFLTGQKVQIVVTLVIIFATKSHKSLLEWMLYSYIPNINNNIQ